MKILELRIWTEWIIVSSLIENVNLSDDMGQLDDWPEDDPRDRVAYGNPDDEEKEFSQPPIIDQ